MKNQKLIKLIQETGLTQQEIAERAGLSQSSVSQHLSGNRKLTNIESIVRYARLLGVSVDDLMSEEERA